jgi:hypothetical protein
LIYKKHGCLMPKRRRHNVLDRRLREIKER